MDKILYKTPQAYAIIKGSEKYASISGTVLFYGTEKGVLVRADIIGLPENNTACQGSIFAFHIHEGGRCLGNEGDPFADTGGHFNPNGCLHPYHAGDMPPLFGAGGEAFSVFLTDRFTIDDIIGKTVILHSAPDDFTTQPSGNAGEKIACGIIAQ